MKADRHLPTGQHNTGGNNTMANMSYCRFHNTVQDMQDCFDAMAEAVDLQEPMQLSADEQRAFQRMYDMLQDMQAVMDEVTELEDEQRELA